MVIQIMEFMTKFILKIINIYFIDENFIKDLASRFPGEEKNIRNYVQLVRKLLKDVFFNLKIIKSKILYKLLQLYLKYWEKD